MSLSDDEAPAKALRKTYLIFNPAAGHKEDSPRLLEEIKEALDGAVDLHVLETQPDVKAGDLTKQALEEGAEVVIASGGDGTVGAVASALVDTGVPLGIISRGTANAFATALGIPTPLSNPIGFASAACEVIRDGDVRKVDTASVTTSTEKDMTMILLLGIGYEAEVCEAADSDMKDSMGPLAYIVCGAQRLAEAANFKAKVVVRGGDAEKDTAEGEVAAITIANVAPPFSVLAHGHTGECIPDDGKLETIGYHTSEESTVANVLGMVKLFSGSLLGVDAFLKDEKNIFGGRFESVRIECDPPQKVVIDGDMAGMTPVSAKVKPSSLAVLVPAPREGLVDKMLAAVGLASSSESSMEALETITEPEPESDAM